MDAPTLLTRLCHTIDEHKWADLTPLLHDDFVCHYVHTGESFDREAWVRVNADYPGFDRMHLRDLVGSGDRAVARCRVTGRHDGQPAEFEVATFVTARGGRIAEMTEVWTDVAQTPPDGTRPA